MTHRSRSPNARARLRACPALQAEGGDWLRIPVDELPAADPRDRALTHHALVRKARSGRPAQRRRATVELMRRYLEANLREAA